MEVGLALAAAQVGVAVADWLISPVAERVVNRALSYLGSSSSDNIKSLETNTQLVKAILRTAGSRPHGHILEPWMKRLKAAYSEAEDILDVIDYHRIENQVLSQNHDESAASCSPRDTGKDICKCIYGLKFWRLRQKEKQDINIPRESNRKLKEALDTISNLISEGQQLFSQLNLQASCENIINIPNSTLPMPIPTTSFPPACVIGRDVLREEIIGYLNGSPAAGRCYTVVGIHGIAGSGKTTLAQHVLEKECKDESFDAIMWIHVTQTFSVVNILNEMLGIASGKTRAECEQSNPDMLQRNLNENLKGKRFFLVLDDVWYKKDVTEQKLRLLLHPLNDGKIGSRILITSRTTDVARALGAKSNLISDLEEEEYMSMFMYYALHDATLTEEASREYHSIGRRIAAKLGRSPLAATTVAAQLKIRLDDIEYWRYVLQSDLGKDAKGALFWSYQQLEEHAKQCFRYCSIFPRRYELERDELVRLWMEEGFVETNSDEEDIEKVAKDYFHVLLSSSFIQPKRKIDDREYFTIHDLLHDLAEDVARSDCCRVESGMVGPIPPDVRHIFLESYDPGVFTQQILKLKNLHTLIMCSRAKKLTKQEFESLLHNLRKLRVLHVRLRGLEELPKCIGELKHLRSLRIWGFPMLKITLPPRFTKLFHLQRFSTSPFCRLKCSADEKMANLVNLQYLLCEYSGFPNIGRLTWLRTLRLFTVKKTKGYEIHQLERLDHLSGTLFINGLENVKSKEEALQAKLDNKVCISTLILTWSRESELERTSCVAQQEIFQALRPPFLIKSLIIRNYRGLKYPCWLEEKNELDNMQHLEFIHCDARPKTLVPCQALQSLSILRCGWDSLPENMECLESLRMLLIQFCTNLESLPELPRSLDVLQIYGCPKLTESYEKGGSSWEKIQQTTTVKFPDDFTQHAAWGILHN